MLFGVYIDLGGKLGIIYELDILLEIRKTQLILIQFLIVDEDPPDIFLGDKNLQFDLPAVVPRGQFLLFFVLLFNVKMVLGGEFRLFK